MKWLLSILLFIYIPVFSQNLVPNPDFEAFSTCPILYGALSNAAPWSRPNNHRGDADFFNTCNTSNIFLYVPANFAGTQWPASGNGYVGFIPLNYPTPNYREYLQVKLISPLVAGMQYKVSLKYSLGDASWYAVTDALSFYFSSAPVSGPSPLFLGPLAVVPQITNTVLLDNKTDWTTLSYPYIATGGEQYMVIGNFLDDDNTFVAPFPTPGFGNSVYMYLDDVAVVPDSSLLFGFDTTICNGQPLVLTPRINPPGAAYLWQDNSTQPTYTVTQSGTYWVTITSPSGILTDTIVINFNNLPPVNLGPDLTLCPGDTLNFTVNVPGATYLWSDGGIDSVLTVTQPGTYWVSIRKGSCRVSDTLVVTYTDLPVNLGPDFFLCENTARNLILNIPGATFLWSDGGTDSTLTVTQPGTYWVRATKNNCTVSDTVVVSAGTLPRFSLGNDTAICTGNSLLLQPDNFCTQCSYLWSSNVTAPTYTINTSGTYWLRVTNNLQCAWTDTINISGLRNCNIWVPDIFTPNNDGLNDVFKVAGLAATPGFQFLVYNRWGQKVFETRNVAQGWNGYYGGKLQPNGSYIYFISYTSQPDNKPVRLKGTVLLVQ
jgi:gliding motility-associated-like protein